MLLAQLPAVAITGAVSAVLLGEGAAFGLFMGVWLGVWFAVKAGLRVDLVVEASGVRVRRWPFSRWRRFLYWDVWQIDLVDRVQRRGRRSGRWEDTVFVVRRGPALVLRLHDGRVVVITVDEPSEAAGAIREAFAAHAGARASARRYDGP